MRPAYEWTEADIDALLNAQRPEDLSLEYKAADSLNKSDKSKSEIAKDISAMANSAGGVVLYGINEQKRQGGPIIADGINPQDIPVESLEQVIDSRISRRIPGLRVTPIPLTSTPGKSVYAVYVPQSNLAPHMTADHRYSKRLGTTTAFMEEYEIRDVGRRSEAPDLYLDLRCVNAPQNLYLHVYVNNSSPEPAYHANLTLYLPSKWTGHGSNWKQDGFDDLLLSGNSTQFSVVRHHWGIPQDPPVLEGERYAIGVCLLSGPRNFPAQLAWGIRAPKMKEKLRPIVLLHGDDGLAVREQPFPVSRPE